MWSDDTYSVLKQERRRGLDVSGAECAKVAEMQKRFPPEASSASARRRNTNVAQIKPTTGSLAINK